MTCTLFPPSGGVFKVRGEPYSEDKYVHRGGSETARPANDWVLNALQKDGQDGLIKALGREKRGTLQIGSRLGRDVQAVWLTRTEEGRKISALSERWQGYGELRRGARSLDYPLTYIEIFIEEDGGKGDGSLIPAARVRSKGGNNIEIENFGIYPARLTNIKVGKK